MSGVRQPLLSPINGEDEQALPGMLDPPSADSSRATSPAAGRTNARSASTSNLPINQGTPARRPYVPDRSSLMASRMRYYQSLSPSTSNLFTPPAHVIPAYLYNPTYAGKDKVSSLTTIFSLWNTMMGSSLLAIPWGFQQSGILLGMGTVMLIGLVCFYSCYLILRRSGPGVTDFADVCQRFLGDRARLLALGTAFAVMSGVVMVYTVIMSESLFDFVSTVLYWSDGSPADFDGPDTPYWTPTVAAIIVSSCMLPLTLLKDVSILLKVNQMGILNVLYVCFLIVYKSASSSTGLTTKGVELTNSLFYQLAGVLMISFFIHTAIISMMAHNRNQENNTRDLSIGFGLVAASYIFVGTLPNLGFAGEIIPQNFLTFFEDQGDIFVFVANFGMLFQLGTVLPFVLSIVRITFFTTIYDTPYPSFWGVFILNSVVLVLGAVFAVFFPDIGTLLRYIGSICGFIYIFSLPIIVQIYHRYKRSHLRWWYLIGHVGIIVLGLVLLAVQFVP